jgi:type IV pilus assembly protein PilY1
MTDYCQIPPYVVQNVPSNIMIIVDNSGSMFNFAYSDGFETPLDNSDDNNCADSGSPCTGFTNPGAYPTYKYYGYFNPDYWYKYASNRFYPTDPKTGSGITGARAKASDEWDGNFLNWVTMRRVDIVRKVLTGGKTTSGEGTGYDRLIGEKADCDGRGKYKRIANAGLYTPYSGTRKLYVYSADAGCGGGGSGTSSFSIRNSDTGGDGTGDEGTWNVAVRVPIPVEGLLQNLVGTKARLGLTFYNTNEGGKVQVSVGGTSLSSMVNQINLTRPSANTPLAETLWSVAGYFGQVATFQGYSSGPGPRYSGGDYTINNNNDPYNYSAGGRWPACAKSFVLLITDGEPCSDGNLPSGILNYAQTAGSSFNCGSSPQTTHQCPAVAPFSAGNDFPSCSAGGNVAGIEDVALWAHTKDLRNYNTLGGTSNSGNISGTQNLTLYLISAFGKGSTLLRYAAINGGFEDSNSNNLPDLQSEWDKDGNNEPDTYYEATDGYDIENAVRSALSTMLKRASSGTAASVLASGEGSGANLIQAVFYPQRRFGNDVINWTGSLQNLWYYVDPFFANSNIREDTLQETPDRKLNLINDYIAQLYFDITSQTTKAKRYQDTDGDGDADTTQTTVAFESLGNIWEAGSLLWSRDVTAAATKRKIYTTINGTSFLSGNFSKDTLNGDADNSTTLLPYFDLPTSGDVNTDGWIDGDLNHDGLVNATDAVTLIKYIHGEDIDLDADGIFEQRARTVTIGGTTNVWKLGDILNSTPKISSWLPLNSYNTTYSDTTYQSFVDATAYKNRGMVFAGGNDGMLHAFKLGKLEIPNDSNADTCTFGTNDKACLSNPTGYLGGSTNSIGHEMWAFIPKNVLPYLRYILDPDYCHVYNVDMTPYIFDASINIDPSAPDQIAACSDTAYSDYWKCKKSINSWKTILIGGMRTGGACRKTGVACNSGTDCVNTPKTDPADSSKGLGYSSYFALDITDQSNPTLLWEYSHPELGFATTGPAVVRIKSRTAGIAPATTSTPDADTNGRWFVVFGSGPTGPVSSGDSQFLGRSDQNMKLFVLDLKTGALATTNPIDTGITFAFAGSMLNATHDSDTDYQDDAVYIPYVKKCTATTNICTADTWTNGGIGRLFTKEDLEGNDVSSTGSTALNPNNWVWNKVIDNVGTVTSAVARLEKKSAGLMWLYFGTGRYYFVQGSTVDDADNRRMLFGIKDPCFSTSEFDTACTTLRTFCTTPCSNPPTCTEPSATLCGELTNVTDIANTPANPEDASFKGWYINLEGSGSYTYAPDAARNFKAERVITDPLATASGVVFFTTYKPYSDECDIGGKSFIWAVKYSTGGSAGALLKGKALMQVSTGSIEQLDLSTAFSGAGGRRTTALEGVPPTAQGLSLISMPPPVKRILHIRER